MNLLKKLSVFFVIVLSIQCTSQVNSNYMKLADYKNIKIQNCTLEEIVSTKANVNLMKACFGSLVMDEVTFPDNYRQFDSDDFSIEFIDNGNGFVLTFLEVLSSDVIVSIDNRTASIGMNIDTFINSDNRNDLLISELKTNTKNSYAFSSEEDDSSISLGQEDYFIIEFDTNTRLINKIYWLIL